MGISKINNLLFGLHSPSKKVENNFDMIFELAHGRKTIECLCLGTTARNYQSGSCPLEILKTNIFALKASLLGKIYALRTANFRGASISR